MVKYREWTDLSSVLSIFISLILLAGLITESLSQQLSVREQCTVDSVLTMNFATTALTEDGFTTTIKGGSRMGSLGGSDNILGDDDMNIVNSVIFGYSSNMTHSNSVLFAFGQGDSPGTASQRPYEFRVRADNGAVFEHTPLRASALLVRDQDSARQSVTSLSSYLTSTNTTGTDIVKSLPTYRYTWSSSYSPNSRYHYGFKPFEVVSIDSTIGVTQQTVVLQTSNPTVVNNTSEGICGYENQPPSSTFLSNDIDHGAIDVGSLIAMMAQSIKELDARLTALGG